MKFQYPHEPFSPAARVEPGRWADSALFRQLTDDLRRFCCGTISGTSYLVAGFRGSGKTTTVLHAIESVYHELKTFDNEWAKRYPKTISLPLFIPLHGPDLLPPDDVVRRSEAQDRLNGQASVQTPDGNVVGQFLAPERTDDELHTARVRFALKQITRSIYRRLAEEIGRSFARAVDSATSEQGPTHFVELGQSFDRAHEWAAKLQADLIYGIEISALYAYWQRIRRISAGVVLAELDLPNRGFQGLHEIQALHAATLAYRNVTGKTHESLKRRRSHRRNRESARRLAFSGADFIKYASAFLGFAGVAYGVSEKNGLIAASSALAALLGGIVANWSSKRRRSQSVDHDFEFTPDVSVAALDRLVPILIKRVREAGLAPVFVIDELDKVKRAHERLDNFLDQLKFMMTGQAFFCCITGPDYFGDVERRLRRDPHGPASTYFSHRVFLDIDTADLHTFADATITVDERR